MYFARQGIHGAYSCFYNGVLRYSGVATSFAESWRKNHPAASLWKQSPEAFTVGHFEEFHRAFLRRFSPHHARDTRVEYALSQTLAPGEDSARFVERQMNAYMEGLSHDRRMLHHIVLQDYLSLLRRGLANSAHAATSNDAFRRRLEKLVKVVAKWVAALR